MFLKSDLLYLRALESTDLEFLYQLENNTAVWRVSNTVAPYSREVLQLYLEHATADIYTTKQLRLLICSQAHQPVGVIDLYDYEPLHQRAGVGIVIAEDFRQQRFAAEALALLLDYCHNYLLLHQVYCTIAISNVASIKLFQNADFTSVGLRKHWIRIPSGWEDVLEFQKILG